MTEVLTLAERAGVIEPTMIRSLRAGMGPSTIDFGLGQTDLRISEAVRRWMAEQADGPGRTPYTPNAGSPEARRAVAQHMGVSPDQVLLTCGVQQGMALAILGLCDPGDEVLVPDPGFPAYDNLVRAAGATPVPYGLREPTPEEPSWSLDVSAVVDAVGERTRMAVLNNPSNPTGAVYAASRLGEVVEALADRGVGYISDEIYEDYVWEGTFVSARDVLPDHRGGVVLSGLSKSHHLMGWRIGWLVGPSDVIRGLTPLHQHLVTCAPRPAQEAAVVALGEHDEAMEETRTVFGRRRKRVLDALEGLPAGVEPASEGAFYLFVDVRPWLARFSTTAEMAAQLLEEEDVMVIPGEGFGSRGLGHLRVAYTMGGEMLDEGLDRLRRFLVRTYPESGDQI